MMEQIAKLHIKALPYTWTSRRGVAFVVFLYAVVGKLGYIKTVKRDGRVVGVLSGIARWILTLVVDPSWQRKGIGRELIEGLEGRRYVYTEAHNLGFYRKFGFRQLLKLNKVLVLWRK